MEKITHNGVQIYPRAVRAYHRAAPRPASTLRLRATRAMRLIRNVALFTGALAALSGASYAYGQMEANRTMTVVNTIVPAPKASMAAVMARIAGCESEGNPKAKGRQFNADGSLVTHKNADGSLDIGKFQINVTAEHLNQAMKMRLDLTTEAGNEAFANWIYENIGTGPWYSSRACWQ